MFQAKALHLCPLATNLNIKGLRSKLFSYFSDSCISSQEFKVWRCVYGSNAILDRDHTNWKRWRKSYWATNPSKTTVNRINTKLGASVAHSSCRVRTFHLWYHGFDYHCGRYDTYVKRVSQRSTESRGFSPGTPVSSHRECWQGGISRKLTLPP